MLRSRDNIVRIADKSLGDRPRERLMAVGPHSLSDAELIALVLRTGNGRKDAIALARQLLDRFGGIHGVLGQEPASLLAVTGLGHAKVAALAAIRELLTRAELAAATTKPVVTDSNAARRFISLHLAGKEREIFGAMLLNTRHHVLAVEDLFLGSVDRSCVYPRELVKCCMRYNAAAVILYHNHPSGVAEPSQSDRDLNQRLTRILNEMDVRLLDHVVVAGMHCVSMADRGWL